MYMYMHLKWNLYGTAINAFQMHHTVVYFGKFHACTCTDKMADDLLSFPKSDDEDEILTDQEWDLFECRGEEGYDLPPSGRYLLWLKMYHPELVKLRTRLYTCIHVCTYS